MAECNDLQCRQFIRYPQVSREAYAALEGSLSEPDFDRLATAKHRFAPASLIIGRQKFCAVPKGYSIHEVGKSKIGGTSPVGYQYKRETTLTIGRWTLDDTNQSSNRKTKSSRDIVNENGVARPRFLRPAVVYP